MNRLLNLIRTKIMVLPFHFYRRNPIEGRTFSGDEAPPYWATGQGGITVHLRDGKLDATSFPQEAIRGLSVVQAAALGFTLIQAAKWLESQEKAND